MITATLPVPPSTNALFRNVPKVGRVLTTAYKQWRTAAGLSLNTQHCKPLSGPVIVRMTVQENGRRDLDGYPKAVLDLLVTHGLIEGDRNKTVRKIDLEWGDVKGVQVRIEPMEASCT